jgi:hypothetical protein
VFTLVYFRGEQSSGREREKQVNGPNLIRCWTEVVSNLSQKNFGYFVSTESQQMPLHKNIYLVVTYYAQKIVSIKKSTKQ